MQLRFSSKTARLLVREQGLESPERFRVLTDKNVDDIYNVLKKSGIKNPNKMPKKGQHVSVITSSVEMHL